MHMRDTTIEANNKENMAEYFLYHAESPQGLYGLAVEQAETDLFNVSVLFKEPGWELYGVLRYWSFDDRALAEARYLELQKTFEGLDEAIGMKALLAALPAEERRGMRE